MFNVKEISEGIRVSNGDIMMKCQVVQVDGSGIDVTLHKVNYVPNMWIHVFSIHQALKKGHKISNDDVTLSFSSGLLLTESSKLKTDHFRN